MNAIRLIYDNRRIEEDHVPQRANPTIERHVSFVANKL
jgi:hypothetical protein